MSSPRTRWFLLTLAFTVTLAVQGRSAGVKKDDVAKKGRTVLLGTWQWDIETNTQGAGNKGVDVQWQQAAANRQFLVPVNGAGLVVFSRKAFDKITREDLKGLAYSNKKLSNSSLTPGTVVALRTNEGSFAKLKVVKYRALHDFAFPDAKYLTPRWREFVRTQPNVKNYHLEVEWVLYRK